MSASSSVLLIFQYKMKANVLNVALIAKLVTVYTTLAIAQAAMETAFWITSLTLVLKSVQQVWQLQMQTL